MSVLQNLTSEAWQAVRTEIRPKRWVEGFAERHGVIGFWPRRSGHRQLHAKLLAGAVAFVPGQHVEGGGGLAGAHGEFVQVEGAAHP